MVSERQALTAAFLLLLAVQAAGHRQLTGDRSLPDSTLGAEDQKGTHAGRILRPGGQRNYLNRWHGA
jgi:hypothetical protein